jgi:type IV secretion system protein VirD4
MSGRGLHLGQCFNKRLNDFGAEQRVYEHERHAILFGPSGSGKFTRFLAVNLLSDCLNDRSVIVWDPKGEAAAVTAWHRAKTLGHEVKIIDPFGKLRAAVEKSPKHRQMIDAGLTNSVGFNPLDVLNPLDVFNPGTPDKPNPNRNFYDDAAALGEALIKIEGSREEHWPESAQGLVVGLLMWEKILNGDDANLENVREMLTEDDYFEERLKYENGKPVKNKDGNDVMEWVKTRGLSVTAKRMVDAGNTDGLFDIGGYEIASLAQRFQRATDEIVSIRSTADTQTRWLLSKSMRDDLTAKNAINFSRLKEKLTTVYVILPAERLRTHSVWLRLILVSALRALYRPGGIPVTMLIDEMAALGQLRPLEDAFGLVRGYGVQLVGIVQDLGQLKALYRERWESFLANAGLVQGLTPNDMTTAEWMSRRAGDDTIWAQGVSEKLGGQAADRGSESWSQVQVRRLPAYELFGLDQGTGLAWMAGLADTVKFKAPNYWELKQCRERALPNPYAGQ